MFKIVRKVKKVTVWAVIAALMVMMLPTIALAASYSDLTDHWAKAPIEDWINKGLVKGYPDGTFRPDNNISRAEFMALVNNAFNFQEKAAIDYRDVAANAWYTEVIAKAKAAGYIAGYSDGTIKPENPITRQEAANIIMKVNKLNENSSQADKFADASKIANWSKGAIGAVAAEGIMGGYPDGTFKAKDPIKRAEAVVALSKALGSTPTRTYDKAGTYGPMEGTEVIEGNVTVNVGSVTLQNMTINGNLLLAKGIGQGEVTLKNVQVKGTTDVQGGGENSIIVIDSTLGKVTVSKKDGKIRILLSGSSTVSQVLANSGVKLEEKDLKEGGFKEVVIEASKDDRIILVGTFESVTVRTAGVNVELPKETTVEKLILDAKVNIKGQGTVQTAEVKASGVTFETSPKKINTASGVTAPTVGQTPNSGGSGGSKSGGGGDSTPKDMPSIGLEFLGHSAFIMSTAKQKILMDPFEPDTFLGFPEAYTIPNVSSIDLITVSHQHPDHNYVAAAPGVNQVVYGVVLDEEEMSRNFVQVTDAVYGDVELSTILLPHFEEDFFFADEPNAGFIFKAAGMRVVHPGDSFRGIIDGLTADEITALKGETGIDILMLPVGNAFEGAHDTELLVNFINDLDPKIVIPVHQWNTKWEFLDAAEGQGWDIVSKPAIVNFSKDQLPEAGPIVWDMEQTVDFRPLFKSAAIDGSELVITYNEALDENAIPAADDFDVWVNDDVSPVTVNSVEVSGTNVILTLAKAVTSEDGIELDYMVGDNVLQDLAGNTANDLWGEWVENITAAVEENQAPTAAEVTITGTAKVGEVLTGNYTYTDNEGDEEGSSTYQWYRKDYSWSTPQAIPGATGKTYTLTDADADKYIVFSVTPVAGTGTAVGESEATVPTEKVADVLRIRSASTFDGNENGILDAWLIFTTYNINDSTLQANSFMIDGIAATGFSSSYNDVKNNDNMFWIYFAEKGDTTKDVPVLTVQAGAFQTLTGESNRELTAAEDVEKDGAHPVIASPIAENITANGTDIKFTSNETGTAYYVVLPALESAPDYSQVKAGQDRNNIDAALKGSIPVTENVEATINITGLTAGTAYKVYLVAEDAGENVTFSVKTIDVTTP